MDMTSPMRIFFPLMDMASAGHIASQAPQPAHKLRLKTGCPVSS
jgi:hypothetical protein